MKNNKVRKTKHHKIGYYIIFITLFFAIFGIFLYISLAKKYVDGVSLKSDGKISYSIKLKDNSYYDESELPEDMSYVASLIEHIDANISYFLSSSKPLDYKYTYNIDAIVKVYGESDSKPLIEKKYPLLENKTIELFGTSIVNINEKVYLDYNEYNKFVSSYKTSFLLSNNADLTLVMSIKTSALSKEIQASETINDEIKMVLPLTEQVISSNKSTSAGNNHYITAKQNDDKIQNKYAFVAALVSGGIALFFIIKAIFDTEEVQDMAYKKELKRILNMYDLIIVNVENLINESNYETIVVSTFDELKDVHDNVGNPIMFKEINKNKKSVFLIIKDNILYKYILKSID